MKSLCWKDQLKQAVSHQTFFMQFNQILSKNQICNFNTIFYFISYTIFRDLQETILTPLQASTVPFKADQRRAALDPPLPPITRDQIQHVWNCQHYSLEDDYNLATMVNSKLYTIYLANYLSVHLL